MSDDPKLPDASNAPAPEALQTQEDMSETVEESTVSVARVRRQAPPLLRSDASLTGPRTKLLLLG